MLGSNVVPVALAFAVLDLTGSATDLGLVLAARSVATVALLLVGGVWADRLPRHLVMLSADVLRFGTQGAVGILLLTGEAELWHLVVAQALGGAGDAFFNPASTGIVPHTVPPAQLQQANALVNLTTSLTAVGGPALGGVLVATVGTGWAFVADSATFLVSAAFLASMRLPRAAERASAPNFLAELKSGWREFSARTWMLVIDIWAVLGNMLVIASFLVLGPLVAERELNGATSWAIVLTAFGAGAVLGDLAALAFRPRRPLVAACLVLTLFSLPLALLAIPAPTPVIALGALFAAFGLTVFNTLFITTMQEQVPDEALSRVTAYDWLASVAFYPIGLAMVGPLADAIGVATLLLAGAVFNLAAAAFVLAVPSVRGVRRRDTGAPPAPAAVLDEGVGVPLPAPRSPPGS